MKKNILFFTLFQLIATFSFAQTSRVQVKTLSHRSFKGYIVMVDSSAITMTRSWSKNALNGRYETRTVPVSDIREIRLKGRTKAIDGAFIAGGLGLLFGLGIEYAFKTTIEEEDGGGLIGVFIPTTIVGAGLGAIIGSDNRKTEKTYYINGNQKMFKPYIPELLAVSL